MQAIARFIGLLVVLPLLVVHLINFSAPIAAVQDADENDNANKLTLDERQELRSSAFACRKEPLRSKLLKMGGGTQASEDAVAKGLTWLAKHQENDGRWKIDGAFPDRAKGVEGSDIAGTALGLLPFLAAGKSHKSENDEHAKAIEKGIMHLIAS